MSPSRFGLTALLVCWAALLAAMSPAAFRIDEPNIIALAKQVARHPLDPYGFSINWNGVTEPAWLVLANPPLVPAWLAAWASLFGWSEVSLHIAVIPFSIVALIAIALLAQSFGRNGVAIAALALLSPAFVLGSQVVMPDIAMLAAVTLAVAAAMRADRRAWFIVAALAAFVAPLMKYNGVIVFAMLAAIAWQKRTMRSFVIAAAPVVSMIVWAIFGAVRYGSPHVIALQKLQAGGLNPLPAIAAAFGLAVLPIVAWAGAQIDRRALFGGLAIGMVSAATAAAWLDYPIGSSILYGVACGATAAFLLQIRSRDAVLIVWLLAPVVLQFGQRFTSVRYLIAMLPPALLLWRPASRIRLAIGAAIGAILVVALSAADATTANVYRDFVREHRTDRYSGHWGLQYYAEQRGERAVERGENVRDSVTVAKHAFPPVVVDGTTFPVNISIPIRTIDCAAAANFYGNAIANCEHYPIYLPFGFSRREVETFVISDRQP